MKSKMLSVCLILGVMLVRGEAADFTLTKNGSGPIYASPLMSKPAASRKLTSRLLTHGLRGDRSLTATNCRNSFIG